MWIAQGAEAARLVADHRSGWQIANWSFGIGIVCTLAGLGAFRSLLRPRLLFGYAMFAVAVALWIADLVFRLTTTVAVADQSARGQGIPSWYPPLARWADEGLMNAAALAAAVAVLAYAVALRRSGRFTTWSVWWAAVTSVAIIIEVGATGDVIPLFIYLAPAGFGIDEMYRLIRAHGG